MNPDCCCALGPKTAFVRESRGPYSVGGTSLGLGTALVHTIILFTAKMRVLTVGLVHPSATLMRNRLRRKR